MPNTGSLTNVGSSRAATMKLLRFAIVAALVLPLCLFIFASYVSYRHISALTDERMARSLDVLQEQALRVFRSIDATLDTIQEIVADRPNTDLTADSLQLHERLKRIADAYPEIQSAWIFDPTGQAIATSIRHPAPTNNFSDRDYFRIHLAGGQRRFIGTVHASPFGGQPFFAVSRARYTVDKEFAGVLEVSVIPSDFYRFYQTLVNSKGAQYGLLRRDGTMLVRYPHAAGPPVRLDTTSNFGIAIGANPKSGIYTAISQIDGSERRVAYRLLPEFDLYLSSGIETNSIRKEWLDSMIPHLVFGIPATLLLAASLFNILLRTQRLHDEQDRREAAEGALRHTQKLEAIGHLTGGVAHDFNNLLTIIIGNLESADRQLGALAQEVPSKLQRALANAMIGARRAATLTQRLLAFSRLAPHKPEPINANKLLNGLSDFLGRSLGERISLEVVGSAGLWTCEADRSELEAALVNLAVNARDALPNGGKLTIETSNIYLDEAYCRSYPDVDPGQYVLISVTDTGGGMAPNIVQRAFEPFFTTKPPGQGTGLGLSQVYGFVKQSGGHIQIYSEVGEGTTFKIYLPRLQGDAREPIEAPEPTIVKGQGEVILVVEDDAEVRGYVVETLRDLNYRVRHAASAEKALEATDAQPLDLLLTDVVLPGMNGRELADEMLNRQPALKVIYMTGYSRNAIVHQGRLDPGIEMLQKPLTSAELARKVRQILEKNVTAPQRG